jgi:chemotaxis protein methyltransferase CheR
MSEDINKIIDFLSDATGWNLTKMHYDRSKKVIENRVKEKNISIEEYQTLVITTRSPQELSFLINHISINQTYFFRDFEQLQSFSDEILPHYIEEKEKENDFNLKILSVACSTGDEPYTLAIILKELLDLKQWNVQIDTFDINSHVLKVAEVGQYKEYNIKDVPFEYKMKYFYFNGNFYELEKNIKDMCTFSEGNVINKSFMRTFRNYDFIFCRNILFYLTKEKQVEAISQFYGNLRKGGFLYLGHAEHLGKVSKAFDIVKTTKRFQYKKN